MLPYAQFNVGDLVAILAAKPKASAPLLRGLEIDDEFELGRLLDRGVGRPSTLWYLVDTCGGADGAAIGPLLEQNVLRLRRAINTNLGVRICRVSHLNL